MTDERDPQAHRIMELRRQLDEALAAVGRVRRLADAIEEDWETVYADYEDDDTAAVIRRALDGGR